jgi:hypothetical protein
MMDPKPAILKSHAKLARKLGAMERQYDSQFKVVFDALRKLVIQPELTKRRIDFLVGERPAPYGKPPITGHRIIK